MTEITLKLELKSKHLSYLQLINGILKLSDMQLNVLAGFLSKANGGPLCSREHRKQVEQMFDIKNVNTYVKFFKDRNLIVSNGKKGTYYPAPLLIPPSDGITIKTNWI